MSFYIDSVFEMKFFGNPSRVPLEFFENSRRILEAW